MVGKMSVDAPASPATQTEWLTDAEQEAWRPFITAVEMLRRTLNAELLRAHDLSLDDYAILAMLSEAEDDRLRLGDLAGILRVPKAHITYRVKRLVDRDLIEREACETDARGVFAVLTAAGREAVEAAAPTHVTSVRRHLLDHLTPEQLRAIGEGMRAVVDAGCDDVPDRT